MTFVPDDGGSPARLVWTLALPRYDRVDGGLGPVEDDLGGFGDGDLLGMVKELISGDVCSRWWPKSGAVSNNVSRCLW